jgi:phage-related protein
MIINWQSSGGTSVSFSKSDPTYILLKDYQGFATPDVSYKTVSAPFQDGETLLDTRFSTRKFSINLMVTGPTLTDIQTAINTLIRLFNPGSGPGILTFIYEDGTSYYINCSGKVVPSGSARSNKHQLVRIDLVAHSPLFYTSAQSKTIGSNGIATFPITFPFTLTSNTSTGTATNLGDVAAGATIIIEGDVTNPVITNTTLGTYLAFTKNMDVGDTMTITTHFGNKTVLFYDATDGSTVNGFQFLNADSTFFQINPGNNIITFTSAGAAAGTKVVVTWSDQYSGV